MKPAFIKLRENYASVDAVDQAVLFGEIGWEDLIDKDNFNNTCAIRVSLALIKSGIKLRGRMAIRKGRSRGPYRHRAAIGRRHRMRFRMLLGVCRGMVLGTALITVA